MHHAGSMHEQPAPHTRFVAIHTHRPLAGPLIMLLSVFVTSILSSCAGSRERPQESRETGSALFTHFCESCHGADARGHGVVAPYLVAKTPDLTMIASRHGCQFPDAEIFQFIDGQSNDEQFTVKRHMPIWGYELFGDEADDAQAHQRAINRVDSLVGYLRSIQLSAPCSSAISKARSP